jgi:hypothetical protein
VNRPIIASEAVRDEIEAGFLDCEQPSRIVVTRAMMAGTMLRLGHPTRPRFEILISPDDWELILSLRPEPPSTVVRLWGVRVEVEP